MAADLFALLQQSGTSLATHRAASSVASHNLQNVNTPGFARQRAELAATQPAENAGLGMIGRGVYLLGVSQARDRFVEFQMSGALASEGRSSAKADALTAVTAFDSDTPGNVGDAISAFYASLRDLSTKPGDTTLRQTAVNSARSLAQAFNRAHGSLETARTGLDAKIDVTVTEVNDAAAKIASLNRQIQMTRAGSAAAPNDLLDARQLEVDRLSKLAGATSIENGSGDLTIVLPGGAALVTGTRSSRLAVVADPSNGGHLGMTLEPVAGGGATALPSASVGGALGGMFEARDGTLRSAVGGLDTLAFDLAGALNAVHQGGFGLDGASGRDLFSVGAAAPGAAGRIAVDAAIAADPARLGASTTATGLPGDATNLLALVATERGALATSNATPTATLAKITSDFGGSAQRATLDAEGDGAILDHLTATRESISGVSIDEELVNLMKAQRAFEATSKVITVASEMLDVLMKIR